MTVSIDCSKGLLLRGHKKKLLLSIVGIAKGWFKNPFYYLVITDVNPIVYNSCSFPLHIFHVYIDIKWLRVDLRIDAGIAAP